MIRTPELVAKAKELRHQGHSYTEIARRLEISHTTACKWVDEQTRQVSEEEVIDAIREWVAEFGELPRSVEWEDHRPSTSTVKTVFGSWNNALKAAGFTPRRQRK